MSYHSVYSNKGLTTFFILLSGTLIAFFTLLSFLFFQNLQSQWSPTIDKIEKLITDRHYKKALLLIQKKEKINKSDNQFLIEKGKIWLSLAVERENATKWKNYGQNEKDWMDSQEAKKAEFFFQKAINEKVNTIDGHLYLGILYMKKGWYSSAEMEFLSVLKLKKNTPKALANLGILYTKMERFTLAENELMKAYALTPDDLLISKNLAILYRYYLLLPDSAIIWMNRYLNLNPLHDFDIPFIRKDISNMLKRYPEFVPYEPMMWVRKKQF